MHVEKPSIVMKPWGKETSLCCNDKYVLEIMEIKKGERTSLHYHEDTRVIEASTPELKDIIRIQDDYGRV